MINKKTLSIISVVVVVFVAGGFAYMQSQQSNIDEQQTSDVSKNSAENESNIQQDNSDAQNNLPPLRFPSLVGVTFAYEDDTATAYDDILPLRTFTIPYGQGKSFRLTAGYQSYFADRKSNSDKITYITGGGAAFSDAYEQNLGSSETWNSISVHIGDFAQDECGDDLEILYLLKSAEVVVSCPHVRQLSPITKRYVF